MASATTSFPGSNCATGRSEIVMILLQCSQYFDCWRLPYDFFDLDPIDNWYLIDLYLGSSVGDG